MVLFKTLIVISLIIFIPIILTIYNLWTELIILILSILGIFAIGIILFGIGLSIFSIFHGDVSEDNSDYNAYWE